MVDSPASPEASAGGERSRRDVDVRVLDRRDRSGVALLVSGLSTLSLLAILVDDYYGTGAIPLRPDTFGMNVVAALFAGAALGPLLRRKAVPTRARLRIEEDGIRVGGRLVTREDVSTVSLTRAARGASIGLVDRRGRSTFLEVQSLADATSIVRALGAEPKAAVVPVPAPWTNGAALQVILAGLVATLAAAFLVGKSTAGSRDAGTFGAAAVALAPVAFALAWVRSLRLRATARESAATTIEARAGASAYDDHAALHATVATADETEAPAPEASTMHGVLARHDEPTSAWLARIDALPREASAYRGAALDKEALLALLADAEAPPDARAGAARLLATRHAEPAPSLVRVVEDPDVRLRVEAAAEEDPDEAAEQLERLGPLFRAR